MRRIVIGDKGTASGRVLDDAGIAPLTLALLPGVGIYRMWELDEPPTLPVDGMPPRAEKRFFPGPGGLRFGIISVPPGLSYESDADLSAEETAAAAAEDDAKVPGMMAAFDATAPGMHCTTTVDFIAVLSGQGRLRLGDGTDVSLRPGDCIIQNGTSHAWFNDGSEPFVFCYTLCGVDRFPGGGL